MRETVTEKRVIVDPEHEQANTRMRKSLEAQGIGTERLDAEVRDFNTQLKAIAVGKPVLQGNEQVQIDLPLINRVLAGVEGSYDRVARLLDKDWRP